MGSPDGLTTHIGNDQLESGGFDVRLRAGTTPVKEYYPYVTRRILHLYSEGTLTNVSGVDVEPVYGYVTRINYINGTHRITSGNDLGLNTGAAGDLSRDKGYTKFILRTIGVECAEGDEFLLPHWAEAIQRGQRQKTNKNIRTTAEADEYIQGHFGYPAYVKPVDGSQGANIFKVSGPASLHKVFEIYEAKHVRVALVEKPFNMPDYRIVVLDGQLISAYRRVPLTIVGDGRHTVAQLIELVQMKFISDGRDTRLAGDNPQILNQLEQLGLMLSSKPARGEEVILVSVSNLSAGGTSVDVSAFINPQWVKLATFVARSFNLRLCGLDLACVDITDADSAYCVVEVNAAPGLDHYAMSGEAQLKIVDDLYTKVLNTI